MDDLINRQFGPYRVVSELGRGGMAVVYRGYQASMDCDVALKVLSRHVTTDQRFLARFRQEALVLAQLQHSRILQVYDFGENDGYAYLAMPLVAGGTLATASRQPIALGTAVRFVCQICDALDYAHSKNVVHRDIKPSNILLDERRLNCLVADFGLARILESAPKITGTGVAMGTPAYMSPEQAQGTSAGPRSDVYSLGVVLFELLTGRVPFHAKTAIALMYARLTETVPRPRTYVPDLPPLLEEVVLKALAKDPEERFASARDFNVALALAARQVSAERLAIGQPIIRSTGDAAMSSVFPTIGSDAFLSLEPAFDAIAPASARRRRAAQTSAIVVAGAIVAATIMTLGEQGFFSWSDPSLTANAPPASTGPAAPTAPPTGGPARGAEIAPEPDAPPSPSLSDGATASGPSPGVAPVARRSETPPSLEGAGAGETNSRTVSQVDTAASSGSEAAVAGDGTGSTEPSVTTSRGSLRLQTSTNAEVLIDDSSHGLVDSEGVMIVRNVAPGRHRIRVLLHNKKEFERVIEIDGGAELKLDATLDDLGDTSVLSTSSGLVAGSVRSFRLFHSAEGIWHFGILTISPGRIAWTETATAGHSLGQIKGFLNSQRIDPGLLSDDFAVGCREVVEVGRNHMLPGEHVHLATRNFNFALAVPNREGQLLPKSNAGIPGIREAAKAACPGILE